MGVTRYIQVSSSYSSLQSHWETEYLIVISRGPIPQILNGTPSHIFKMPFSRASEQQKHLLCSLFSISQTWTHTMRKLNERKFCQFGYFLCLHGPLYINSRSSSIVSWFLWSHIERCAEEEVEDYDNTVIWIHASHWERKKQVSSVSNF